MFTVGILGRWLTKLSFLTILLVLIGWASSPKPAAAMIIYPNQGLGYPYWKIPCEHSPYNIVGYCANYDWGPYHTESYDHWTEISSRGYAYRNCTDYVAWKLSTLGVNIPYNLGNATDWYHNTPLKRRSPRAVAGGVAVMPGRYGHVAFIEKIKAVDPDNPMNDVIAVSEYNYFGVGTGDVRVGGAGRLGFVAFIDFGARPN
ncbi:MAG: CHAP domain-containing protein [Candidatus Saccharimonadales bacterium]